MTRWGICTLPMAATTGALLPLTTDLTPLLQRVLETTIELLEADKGTIHLHDPGEGTLKVAAQIGFAQDFLDHFGSVDAGSVPWGTAFGQRSWIVVDDVTTDGRLAFGRNMQSVYLTTPDGKKFPFAMRVTDGYRKIDGKWYIVLEHVSVPVDLATAKGDLMSKP